jgi:hypothetical protein
MHAPRKVVPECNLTTTGLPITERRKSPGERRTGPDMAKVPLHTPGPRAPSWHCEGSWSVGMDGAGGGRGAAGGAQVVADPGALLHYSSRHKHAAKESPKPKPGIIPTSTGPMPAASLAASSVPAANPDGSYETTDVGEGVGQIGRAHV